MHALSDVLSAHLPDSSEFFVHNVVENKNGMIQLFTLVVNEIINISGQVRCETGCVNDPPAH